MSMLDREPVELTKLGKVTIYPPHVKHVQIVAEGFEGANCTCRDVAILACVWAMGELQSGGRIGIG
jgi:hypothetical protein